MPNSTETRDILIRLETQNTEILRRLDSYDKIIVPRTEYQVVVAELQRNHLQNQKDIEGVQEQVRTLMWKIGGALGTLQVVTAIIMFLLSNG